MSVGSVAVRSGLKSVLQREERVPNMDALYLSSGIILLSKISGAECFSIPQGEDEAGTGDA